MGGGGGSWLALLSRGKAGAAQLVLLIVRKVRLLTGAMREVMRKSFLLISAGVL